MLVAKLEGLYYLFMGAWPIFNLRSFETVTGRKTDTWLVMTIAWLFLVTGLQLLASDEVMNVAVLGIGVALVIAGADVYYGLIQRRISRVYALDAIPQVLFVAGWLYAIFH